MGDLHSTFLPFEILVSLPHLTVHNSIVLHRSLKASFCKDAYPIERRKQSEWLCLACQQADIQEMTV